MPSEILVDTSFLYALYNAKEAHHHQAVTFARSNRDTLIMPDVVLVEVAFLFSRFGGIPTVLFFLGHLQSSGIQFEPVKLDDLPRIREIMTTYADAKLDIVDCCIMALAEKLNITRICTFDRRDFSIFRPQHCDHLELLP